MAQISKSTQNARRKRGLYDPSTAPLWVLLIPFLVGAALLLMLCRLSPSGERNAALVFAVAFLVVVFFRYDALKQRLGLPLLVLAAVVLMDGISTLYAVSGKFALNEFLKVLGAFCLCMILLAVAPRRGQDAGRWMAGALAGCSALAGLVSIDLISPRVLSGLFLRLLGGASADYATLSGLEVGVRMTSVFENPNVFAGCVGLGTILSLGLVSSSERSGERIAHTVVLFLNAFSFLLAFSMGASGTIAVAFLLYLFLVPAEKRPKTLVLMAETLLLALVGAAIVSATAFDAWTGVRFTPLLCAVLGAAALVAADRTVGRVLTAWAERHGKRIPLLTVILLAAIALFALVAYNFTGPADLPAQGALRRAAYPDAGTYTLQIDGEGELAVTIESQNRQETMMHTGTVLYEGAAADAAFTVPEDSLVVYFNFSAPSGASVRSASYEGAAGSGKIPLGYRLLPDFIANRLQGLFANENAIQRLVFFSDGLKLFRRAPVFGSGMGAFENGVKSVQSFYYETKYAHNHYIQAMVETGLVGLLLFLGLLGICAAAVWFNRRSEQCHPLTPALGAALLFMAAHALTEVTFSAYPYLVMAFGTFLLINLCCAESLPHLALPEKSKLPITAVTAVLVAGYAVLLFGNISARQLVTAEPTFDSLEKAAETDLFEWADYELSYVASAAQVEDAEIREKADKYAEHLATVHSNTIPLHLAQYYFQTGRAEPACEMLRQYVDYVSSDAEAWQNAFTMLLQFGDGSKTCRAAVLDLAGRLDAWNSANMGNITLSDEANALILAVREGGWL